MVFLLQKKQEFLLQKNKKVLEGALGASFIMSIGALYYFDKRRNTMDVAVLTDIHGNFEAFQTCIHYALERNIKQFLFLGDYVGEFSFPQKTMELLYQLNNTYRCTFIKGNKEDYWLNHWQNGDQEWKEYDSTTGSLHYTYENLTKKDMEFFSSLEITKEIQLPGMETITICHGSPLCINDKLLPEQEKTFEVMEKCNTRLILCGHTHIQRIIKHKDKKVINPGAVGVPLYSSGKTQFMILHGVESGWQEEFVNLAYDVEKEIDNLYLANLNQIAPFWCKTTEQLLRTGMHSHLVILKKAMKYCNEEQGECVWPNIPERYWEKAFYEVFDKSNIQSYSYTRNTTDFPTCIDSKEIYVSEWMSLYSNKVRMPDGYIIDTYHKVHVPRESVCVVIVNEQEEILLIASKRYTTGRLEWEVPAGGIEYGECAETAARRECMEEAGCTIKDLKYMCSQNPSNGISDILIHFYIAKVNGESNFFDGNEVENMKWISKKEVSTILQNNQTKCGVSMFALLYAMQFHL